MKKYIGVDVGGMSIKAAVVTEDGQMLSKYSCPTQTDKPYTVMTENIYNLCLNILTDADLKKEDIQGVGIGCPGTIWREKGIITFANNLDFYNVPLVKEFKKYWNINIQIENDANCAALGENKFGSGKGYKDCVFITLGTGVGTGFIVDGKLFTGRRGAGAEAGHMVIRIDGEKCTCGRRGCWEAYASASALIRETQKAMQKNPDTIMHKIAQEHGKVSGRTAFEASKQNDPEGKRIVKRYVKYIACGVVNLINIFRPEVVIIGGGVSNEGQYFIDMIQRYVNRYHYGKKLNPKAKVVRASLLNDAGILGAASLVME